MCFYRINIKRFAFSDTVCPTLPGGGYPSRCGSVTRRAVRLQPFMFRELTFTGNLLRVTCNPKLLCSSGQVDLWHATGMPFTPGCTLPPYGGGIIDFTLGLFWVFYFFFFFGYGLSAPVKRFTASASRRDRSWSARYLSFAAPLPAFMPSSASSVSFSLEKMSPVMRKRRGVLGNS